MSVTVELSSHCKVNLLLNILGRREDGFHELETVMQPVALHDDLSFGRAPDQITLSCSDPNLPIDSSNLVHRAAVSFFEASGIHEGARIHLEKRIPVAAGLGGGSGNAATTLQGLNQLFGNPLSGETLNELAGRLGSDVPFFLQRNPALATGRGEKVASLEPFPALRDAFILLIHPGFGISTAWAYQQLARFPDALKGRKGRARELIDRLRGDSVSEAGTAFYNALEAPVLRKYPILAIFQDFLRSEGADAVLMSGSGSTTFAVKRGGKSTEALREKFLEKFGCTHWTAVVAADAI